MKNVPINQGDFLHWKAKTRTAPCIQQYLLCATVYSVKVFVVPVALNAREA